MTSMTPSEWRAFLQHGTRTAKVATVRPDGRPSVAPVWFVLDGDDLVFMTSNQTVKGKNILHDPRVMISVDDETPPFAFVFIEGIAAVSDPPPAEKLVWATRIAARYMGDTIAGSYGKRNAVEGELLFRVPLKKVTGRAGLSD